MARIKSKDKRDAILAAAIAVFAERGIWSTPTSAISRAAGIAEGTLFTYFPTKDALVNELYRALKLELAGALLADYPKDADLRNRFCHLWNHYVSWGIENPARFKLIDQLSGSDRITAASQAVGRAPFAEVERLGGEIRSSEQVHNYPPEFIAAIFNGMAEATMAVIAQAGGSGIDYRALGFEVFWRGIAKA